ncbi:response regulator [Brevibacillus daliensis]|uniref:response regulator n=1 Tax=Brevibacillus daliensis TaxID=2892995 RepID=UPI001E4A4862|nr:response regulator [Brevibacillus daliensis]
MLLIDDERLALRYLENMLQDIKDLQIVGKFQDPRQALEEMQQVKPDLVFLDVEMPEMNGIETAEQILRYLPDTDVVFVTAYEDYAVKAFELNALDYVLKPVQRERLQKTLLRIQKEKETKNAITPSGPLLHIRCFQSLQIEVSGRHGPETIHWRTTKAQELFAYLIHRRGQPVRKDLLLELFWADVEWKKGYAQLYTTVYQIRKTLDQLEIGLKITNCDDGYLLEMSDVSFDVDAWESGLRKAPPITNESVIEHMRLVELYRGDYFSEYDYMWAESERQRLRADWYNHAAQVGNFLVINGEYSKAIAFYLRMQQFHPHLEELFFTLMKLYDTMGDREAVEGQYNSLTDMLREEFEMAPHADVREWYKQWKSSK